jgi:hypothetical protein
MNGMMMSVTAPSSLLSHETLLCLLAWYAGVFAVAFPDVNVVVVICCGLLQGAVDA